MMILVETSLPPQVQADIKDWYAENSQGKMPSPLTLEQALNAYLSWNEIIGHTDFIMAIIRAAAKP